MIHDVVIVGSGPAGYTCAIYAARANRRPLVIEGAAWGGLLQQTSDVENFPGFPGGITGPALMQAMRDQAERFGACLQPDDATQLRLAARPGDLHEIWVEDELHRARTVVLAMGAEHKRLGVPGELELASRGVSYCATCDAAFFRGAETLVVGGGDSAMEEAIQLSKFAARVTVVHRRDALRASSTMIQRACSIANIELRTPFVVEAFEERDGDELPTVRLAHAADGSRSSLRDVGTFVAIGHRPRSELVAGQVARDPAGYIVTRPGSTGTNRPGVFAAGDVVDATYRQAITAAGSGCMAALDAERYLRDLPAEASA